jgi:hypothetical protein
MATKQEVQQLVSTSTAQGKACFREGMTSIPNVGVMHGAHLNQFEELGLRLDQDRKKPFSVEDEEIGHPGGGSPSGSDPADGGDV